MKRVRPVLVTPLLAAALLVPAAPAHAKDHVVGASPVDEVLKHGDLVGAVVTYPSVMTEHGETHATVTTDHYDTRGRLVLKTEVETDASGAVVFRREASSEYDAKGGLAHQVDVSDFDGDGPEVPITQATATTFDKLGYALQMTVTADDDSDGIPEQSDTYTFGNDHKGRAVSTVVERDWDGDGAADSVVRGVTTYDAKGNVLRDAGTYATSQGEVTGSGETVNTYDQHGQLTSSRRSELAADGSLVFEESTSTTFDVHGNALTISSEYDMDGVPGPDYNAVVTNAYDGRQRLLVSTQRGSSGDGTPFGVYETRYTYDGPGDYVTMEILADDDGDGTLDPQGRLDVTYDRQGRPLLYVGTSAESTSRDVFTYDNQGRRTSFVSSWYDTEGTLLSRSTTRYAYPSRTDYTITTEIDYDGDGVPEVTSVESRQGG